MTVKKGIYQHYKGGQYMVIAQALSENDHKPVVVYKSLDGNPVSEYWVRGIEDFLAEVEIDEQSKPRFKFISADSNE
ncbi:MAG: DUF1653 domain-containing protein [Candidatus Doudnabacteria bacterium]